MLSDIFLSWEWQLLVILVMVGNKNAKLTHFLPLQSPTIITRFIVPLMLTTLEVDDDHGGNLNIWKLFHLLRERLVSVVKWSRYQQLVQCEPVLLLARPRYHHYLHQPAKISSALGGTSHIQQYLFSWTSKKISSWTFVHMSFQPIWESSLLYMSIQILCNRLYRYIRWEEIIWVWKFQKKY